MTTEPRRPDVPTVEAESAPYWEAAARGELQVAECRTCGALHHYPRPFCPTCWSAEVVPRTVSGRATLYTYSVVYSNDLVPFKDRVPYVAAVVDLEEGPRLMTSIVDCPIEDLHIGMALTARFQRIDDELRAPVFGPA
jgi:uncharacterized OB-fold protein